MIIVYLDTSAIVKRYIQEPGSNIVSEVYRKAWSGELIISFSTWNVGEVLGVLNKYYRRGWLETKEYEKAKYQFLGETIRMLKLKLIKIVPVRTRLLIKTWPLIEKYHIYEADALQIVSAKHVKAQKLYTGDKQVHEVAVREGVNSIYLG